MWDLCCNSHLYHELFIFQCNSTILYQYSNFTITFWLSLPQYWPISHDDQVHAKYYGIPLLQLQCSYFYLNHTSLLLWHVSYHVYKTIKKKKKDRSLIKKNVWREECIKYTKVACSTKNLSTFESFSNPENTINKKKGLLKHIIQAKHLK